jgi:hypothetical protein
MADVAFVAVLLVFFALATLFVRGCDRIIGSGESELTASDATTAGADRERAAA